MSDVTAVQRIPAEGATPTVGQRDATEPVAIVELLRLAVERGVPVEMLERLESLHERVSARAAAAAFNAALARAQASCPPIPKTKTAQILLTKNGTKYTYQYADLEQIARTIAPGCRENDLSYTWDSEIRDQLLVCRCTLRHVAGHAETSHFSAPIESPAGMSAQQKYAAALTYARRQSLIQVLGLTTCDPDTDGANPEPITEQQVLDLEALLQEVGADPGRFLRWAGVNRLEAILQRDYESAVKTLRSVATKRAERGRA